MPGGKTIMIKPWLEKKKGLGDLLTESWSMALTVCSIINHDAASLTVSDSDGHLLLYSLTCIPLAAPSKPKLIRRMDCISTKPIGISNAMT
jgi:hypothetical protein